MNILQFLVVWAVLGAALIGFATSSGRRIGSPRLVNTWLVLAGPLGWLILALVWALPHFVNPHIPEGSHPHR